MNSMKRNRIFNHKILRYINIFVLFCIVLHYLIVTEANKSDPYQILSSIL